MLYKNAEYFVIIVYCLRWNECTISGYFGFGEIFGI